MLDFEKNVFCTIKKYNMASHGEKILVGLSGGADSLSLLIALSALRSALSLSLAAVHVNHGIRGAEADRDEEYCRKICVDLGVELFCESVNIPQIAKDEKISEELAGRKMRYRIFHELREKIRADRIAVAHNKNDSAETVIMKLVRGCSLNGLRGIAPTNGCVVRPLIETDREDIEKYLAEKNISFMNDSTNSSDVYTRNIIRNEVFPILKKINPSVVSTIFADSKNIACDDDFIEDYAKGLYNDCITKNNCDIIVNFGGKDLHNCIKKRIILYTVFLLKGDKNDIEQKHIDMILQCDSAGKTGKNFDIGCGITVWTEYGKLVFSRNLLPDDDKKNIKKTVLLCDFPCKINWCGHSIKFEITGNNDISDKSYVYIDYDKLAHGKITLRTRRDGDRFSPSGMNGEKKLKKFFIDSKTPLSVRDNIPLLCTDDKIAAVLGMRVGADFIVTDKTKNILKISISGGTND